MTSCIVPGCPSNEDTTVQFYFFPKNLELCQIWAQACNLVNTEINLDEGMLVVINVYISIRSYKFWCI